MKISSCAAIVGLVSLLASAAHAGQPSQHGRYQIYRSTVQNEAYARVISATPIYETLERRSSEPYCTVESRPVVYETKQRGHGGNHAALGGLVGGAIGHSLGKAVGHDRKSRRAGAVTGAVVGAIIGSEMGQQHRHPRREIVRYADVEHCEIRDKISTYQQLVGYDVTYQYSGQRYSTRMQEHPGDRIRVVVDVRPARR